MIRSADMKWDIDIKSIEDPGFDKWRTGYDGALAQMRQRTHHHELYGLIAKNKSIHEMVERKASGK